MTTATDNTIRETVERQARAARAAATQLQRTSAAQRDAALQAMAEALHTHEAQILAANRRDIEAARADGTRESLIDRLMLDSDRLSACADALRDLAALDDVLGEVLDERTIAQGIALREVRVPLGVVGMIYEARPNVTCDAAGIGIKTGNAILLRGGSMARESNDALVAVIQDALVAQGLPRECVQAVDATDRASATAMMGMRGLIDLLIPRGGAGLIASVVENSKVPVIETGTGNCHVYIEKSADLVMAHAIVLNAKCQRPSVCNAAESLLIDRAIADEVLADIVPALAEAGVTLAVDPEFLDTAPCRHNRSVRAATDEDYATEYLDLEMSIKIVDDVDEAVAHINEYGTQHSEAIVTQSDEAAQAFVEGVDAAAVYVNASTRFTDGALFGLGAEIGISTQKMHARGPFALKALTSTKFICTGSGQIRE
ncbi:MAG: glutamate-5-semialdehyde dehydrogenase [Coriobacteriia bacterium]|nr:glutamate-5-semialdehyde dehydrogenase [Coriobacteriia bacterium]